MFSAEEQLPAYIEFPHEFLNPATTHGRSRRADNSLLRTACAAITVTVVVTVGLMFSPDDSLFSPSSKVSLQSHLLDVLLLWWSVR